MKFSINIFGNILKANLFTSLILIDSRSKLDPTFQIKYLYLVIYLKVIIFANNTNLKMIKLAIVFLPIVIAIIWVLFIGLRINKVETRDGNRKLINY